MTLSSTQTAPITSMTPATKRLFVKCWKAEYAATVKANKLSDDIDLAYILEKPVARLENSLSTWNKKQNEACDALIPLVESGELTKDVVDLCREELGEIYGYVCDCYHDFWLDFNTDNS